MLGHCARRSCSARWAVLLALLAVTACQSDSTPTDTGTGGDGVLADGVTRDATSDATSDRGTSIDSAPIPSEPWAKMGTGPGNNIGEGIGLDASGNVYVCGHFPAAVTFGDKTLTPKSADERDAFVVKLSPAGEVEWAVSAGGAKDDRALAIAVDPTSGDSYVAGYFTGTATFGDKTLTGAGLSPEDDVNAFVARYAGSDGSVVWATQLGSPYMGDDRAFGIALDAQGNPHVTGYFQNTATFGGKTLTSLGSWDAFVAKLSAGDGSVAWATGMGGTAYDLGRAIDLDASDNAYITGFTQGNATFGPDTWIHKGDNSEKDMFVAKLSPTGEVLWGKGSAKNTDDGDKGNAISVDPVTGEAVASGYCYLADGFYGVLVSKFSPSGEIVWERTAGSDGWNEGLAVAVDGTSNIYVTGIMAKPGTFGSINLPHQGYWDIFVAKWSPSGEVLAAVATGATSADAGYGIALGLGSAGVLPHVTGEFDETVPFGATSLTADADSRDAFIWKMAPLE